MCMFQACLRVMRVARVGCRELMRFVPGLMARMRTVRGKGYVNKRQYDRYWTEKDESSGPEWLSLPKLCSSP